MSSTTATATANTHRVSTTALFSGIFIVVAGGRSGMALDLWMSIVVAVALLFNAMIVIIAITAVAMTVPKDDPRAHR